MADDEEGEEVLVGDRLFPRWFGLTAAHWTLHPATESHEGAEFGRGPDLRGAIAPFGEILGAFVAEDLFGDAGIF